MIMFRVIHLKTFLLLIFLLVLSMAFIRADWFWKWLYPWPYSHEINENAHQTGLDPYLVAALVHVESGFNPCAKSPAGALGLMQLMPKTAVWSAEKMELKNFQIAMLTEPELNLSIGCWYLNYLIKEFDGNLVMSLAAYNAGKGNVKKWVSAGEWEGTLNDLQKIPFKETQIYVKRVLKNYQIYKNLYKSQAYMDKPLHKINQVMVFLRGVLRGETTPDVGWFRSDGFFIPAAGFCKPEDR